MTFRVSEAEAKCKRGTASEHRKISWYGASQRTPEGPDGSQVSTRTERNSQLPGDIHTNFGWSGVRKAKRGDLNQNESGWEENGVRRACSSNGPLEYRLTA